MPAGAINTIRAEEPRCVVLYGLCLSCISEICDIALPSIKVGLISPRCMEDDVCISCTTLRMVLSALCASRLSEAICVAAIIIQIYSIGRIILSIKAISSLFKSYFLYSISSVHGWEKSWRGIKRKTSLDTCMVPLPQNSKTLKKSVEV